jgi:hypothetical protein
VINYILLDLLNITRHGSNIFVTYFWTVKRTTIWNNKIKLFANKQMIFQLIHTKWWICRHLSFWKQKCRFSFWFNLYKKHHCSKSKMERFFGKKCQRFDQYYINLPMSKMVSFLGKKCQISFVHLWFNPVFLNRGSAEP